MSKLSEIRERMMDASPGPWVLSDAGHLPTDGWPLVEIGDRMVFSAPCHGSDGGTAESDAAFIAAAPADIEYLLGEVEMLTQANDNLATHHKLATAGWLAARRLRTGIIAIAEEAERQEKSDESRAHARAMQAERDHLRAVIDDTLCMHTNGGKRELMRQTRRMMLERDEWHAIAAGQGKAHGDECAALLARAEKAEAAQKRLRLALENVRLMSTRMKRHARRFGAIEAETNANHLLRFCADVGVEASILRSKIEETTDDEG